jgi:hypothetical protein
VNSYLVWEERDIVNFADALESMRRWQPAAPAHAFKMNPDELAAGKAEAASLEAAFRGFLNMEPMELLDLMAKCSREDVRELMATAFKLQAGGYLHLKGAEEVPDQPATPSHEAN